MKPTRNDVARLAGVSSATVSRVYNNPESVSEEKRGAVISASERLGYSPDKSASALRRNGTGIITLIDVKNKDERYSWESLPVFKWFYSDAIEGIQKVVNKTMYQLNLETIDSIEQIDYLGKSCDGIIVFDNEELEIAEAVRNTELPYILAHHTAGFENFNTCSTDNYYGGRLQAKMLEKRGLTKPVYIAGLAASVISHSERYRGFCSVFRNAELIDPSCIDSNSFRQSPAVGVEAGRTAVSSIMKAVSDKSIDSIAVVNDFTAAGVYYQLSENGIRIPEDLQIVSYDNMPFNSILPLPFSTIDLNPSHVYERAASILINKVMKGKAVAESIKPFEVEGKTTVNSY